MENIRQQLKYYKPFNEQEAVDCRRILEYMKKFPDLLFRENPLAHFTASSLIVNKDCSKTLMIYHNIYDSWSWTGGHADGEGDLVGVAEREAMEETGLKSLEFLNNEILSVDIIPVASHKRKGQYVSAHLHLNFTYLLVADETQPLFVKEDENSGVKWFPIRDMCQVSSETWIRPIYDKLLKKAL